MANEELSRYCAPLLEGSYDCVDRIVLNARCRMLYNPGGFRHWWRRLHDGCDETLDNAHLIRLAGRFARRVRAFANANSIPVIDCARGERKHEIAEEHLRRHPDSKGLFLILVAKAFATVWRVVRSPNGVLLNLESQRAFINHYSFHIVDPEWGHFTIKMASHAPFGAQILLNGHERVACQARSRGIDFTKEGNCFTMISQPAELAKVADTLSENRAVGRLTQLCERWIYSCCLCFGVEQEAQRGSGFRYQYSVYQIEYSRNLVFRHGYELDQVFEGWIDRSRRRISLPRLRTIFGWKARPRCDWKGKAPRLECAIETPLYDMTVFKLHFGKLTAKAYSKGERVLRFEAVAHNAHALKCGRVIERFPEIVSRLRAIVDRFLDSLATMDQAFISDECLEQLPAPSRVGVTRVGGVNIQQPRMRKALEALLSLGCCPTGFRAADLAARVSERGPELVYGVRQAAYDLKKLRGKGLVEKRPHSHHYQIPPEALRRIAALVILREQVLKPILAGAGKPRMGRKPKTWSVLDQHYEDIRKDMFVLFDDLGLAA